MTVFLREFADWIEANSSYVIGTDLFLGYVQTDAPSPCAAIVPIPGGNKNESGLMTLPTQIYSFSDEWEDGWNMQQAFVDLLEGMNMTLSEWTVVRINVDLLPQVLTKGEDGRWMFSTIYNIFVYK